ncbi:hypothetical protein [Bradyrhizobium sp. URHC0002]
MFGKTRKNQGAFGMASSKSALAVLAVMITTMASAPFKLYVMLPQHSHMSKICSQHR